MARRAMAGKPSSGRRSVGRSLGRSVIHSVIRGCDDALVRPIGGECVDVARASPRPFDASRVSSPVVDDDECQRDDDRSIDANAIGDDDGTISPATMTTSTSSSMDRATDLLDRDDPQTRTRSPFSTPHRRTPVIRRRFERLHRASRDASSISRRTRAFVRVVTPMTIASISSMRSRAPSARVKRAVKVRTLDARARARRSRARVALDARVSDESERFDAFEDDDEGAERGERANVRASDGEFAVKAEVSASAESVWRALSRGENLSEFVPTLLVAKRGPKQYASTETEVRVIAIDYTLFTPRMLNTVNVRVVDKSRGAPNWLNGPAWLGFVARNIDERSEFMLVGSFCIYPILGESYKCEVEYRAELKPLRYEVNAETRRRAVENSIPFIISSITKKAMKRDQERLRSPGFLPQLEAPFGVGGFANAEKATEANAFVPSGYLGLSEIKVPMIANGEPAKTSVVPSEEPGAVAAAANVRMRSRGEKSSSNKVSAPRSWQAIGVGAPGKKWFDSDITPFENPGSLEIHMRRYDTDSLLHRRCLAAVRIEAPANLVWELLTNYENMARFVPNLMHSEFIQRYGSEMAKSSATENTKRVRLRQVFVKCELFHAVEEATAMDIVQKDDKGELQFRMLQNARFGALQGKWLVVPAGEFATVLKFAIEGVVASSENEFPAKKPPRDPLDERIAFDEISTMLKQAREFMEGVAKKKVKSYDKSVKINVGDLALKGPGMSQDDEELVQMEISSSTSGRERDGRDNELSALKRAFLAAGFGANETMPNRATLRTLGQWELIKRVEKLGGFVEVASSLQWRTYATRPRGYWTLRNLEKEIIEFIANSDDPSVYLKPKVMPSRKSFAEAGRSDIVNALKRLGGSIKVAEQIGLNLNEERAKAGTRPATSKSTDEED